MASSSLFYKVIVVWVVLTVFLVSRSSAKLSSNVAEIYGNCLDVLGIVRNATEKEIEKEPRMGASLLRLHFHDCFVNGCDGSVLLDDTSTFTGEKNANPNRNSARGFDAIDRIKSAVEKQCPGTVSCADILAIAAQSAVEILSKGQCCYNVQVGRLDSFTANQSAANNAIPAPTFNIDALIKNFNNLGLTKDDLVTLSGGHTIGLARCTNFKSVIYNETKTVNPKFASRLQNSCPRASGPSDNNTAPLDVKTPTVFDNAYYSNIINGRYLLHSDHQLLNSTDTAKLVYEYSQNPSHFYKAFGAAMIKMGALQGDPNGEIRKVCSKRNSN